MKPDIPADLQQQAHQWSSLSRHERSELGKALRRAGLSQREIRRLIPVPKSTLSYWCQDVELTAAQIAAIRSRGDSKRGEPRDTQRKRRRKVRSLRRSAAESAPELLRDPLFASGIALYWAEGSKTQRDLNLANSDPALLRLFILWVRTHLDSHAEFRLSLHLHAGNDEFSAKQFWRHELSLPNNRFTKTYWKPAGSGHRKNHLPNGICRVRVCRSADLWIVTMAWIECMRVQTLSSVATLAPGR